jgi:hypothetical protein
MLVSTQAVIQKLVVSQALYWIVARLFLTLVTKSSHVILDLDVSFNLRFALQIQIHVSSLIKIILTLIVALRDLRFVGLILHVLLSPVTAKQEIVLVPHYAITTYPIYVFNLDVTRTSVLLQLPLARPLTFVPPLNVTQQLAYVSLVLKIVMIIIFVLKILASGPLVNVLTFLPSALRTMICVLFNSFVITPVVTQVVEK